MTSTSASLVLDAIKSTGMSPRGVQQEAVKKGVLTGKSIMVCSPTGSGKTLIGEMALLRAVHEGKRGLYLVPLKALAAQVAEDMTERYGDTIRIGVSTGDLHLEPSDLMDYDLVITTYEKTDSLLRHKSLWLQDLGTVVIDEIQNIANGHRGARLESTVLRLKKTVDDLQIVALSATVGEPELLSEWLGCELISSHDRPVELKCKVLNPKDKTEMLAKLVMATVQKDKQVLVFHRTRKEAEVAAERMSSSVVRHLTSSEKQELDAEMNSLYTVGITMLTKLKKLLHLGVAYHHAGMSAAPRGLVERLFRKGLVRALFATTTLSSGMDLPARTVVITNVASPEDYSKILSANKVHQMLGRAGRPGKDTVGHGLILASSLGEKLQLTRRYFQEIDGQLFPRYDTVRSTFGNSENLTEQLLLALDWLDEASVDEISNLFSESYLSFLGVRETTSPKLLFSVDEIDAVKAIELHALADTVRAASQGVLGTIELRECSERVIGGIVRLHQRDTQTCRFSLNDNGGAYCSCGNPLDKYGILCTHLVGLGYHVIKRNKQLADFVIPTALDVSSPMRTLVKMRLVEGGQGVKVRPTRLGRVINRLYLSIATAKELLAYLPLVENLSDILCLLRICVSRESWTKLDESFDVMLQLVSSTDTPISAIAESKDMAIGDLYSLLDMSRWLLQAMVAISDIGNLTSVAEYGEELLVGLNKRLPREENGFD